MPTLTPTHPGDRTSRPRIAAPTAIVALLAGFAALATCAREDEPEERRPGAPVSLAEAGTGSEAASAVPRDVADGGVQEPASAAGAPLAQRRDRTVVAIFGELREEPLIRGYDVQVGATGTTVVLRGMVPDPAARERVVEITRKHLGTFSLVDSLVVQGAGS